MGLRPILDPLWSTEALSFSHDGCEAQRIDKIRFICNQNERAILENLRVCTTSELGYQYNCGKCEKCLRTMIGLHICGGLELCPRLPHVIDPQLIRSFEVRGPYLKMIFRELLDELGSDPDDSEIAAALADAIARESD